MKLSRCFGLVLVVVLIVMGKHAVRADERENFFETKIRPVLAGTCFRCHGDTKSSGSLRLDSLAALLEGGDSGPAIVLGNPEESLLVRAIQRQEDVSAMPPGKDRGLRADQVADFVSWVRSGAMWPETSTKFETSRHWSFEAPRRESPPDVRDKAWVQTPIDAFVLAKQESRGIHSAPPADKLTLIRRATFDLTGLPPTTEEIDAFMRDSSASAFERVVDRLLNSPAYGERWGRHWLDVVRYADTAGETADYPVTQAWRYRSYVINAFNDDKPYDEFLREQIAGDILAENGPPESYADRVAATGFLAISRRFGFDSENYHHLTIQDTIDTLGQSVMGLTLGCARCHDHKFDPVSSRDYYGLYGIFDSTRYAFPGSEQKQRVRSMLPLLPRSESQRKWDEYRDKVVALSARLDGQKPSAPPAVLRSLHDIDGDFELQAPAAGGSKGVLVPPWLSDGQVALTTAAQSPYRNLNPPGKVGVSLPAGDGEYRIYQAIYPRRNEENCNRLYVNLDFRVSATDPDAKGHHGFVVGSIGGSPVVEVLFTSDALSLRSGDRTEEVARLKVNEWYNLQLVIDLKRRTVSLSIGMPGSVAEVPDVPIPVGSETAVESVEFRSLGQAGSRRPAIEFDNLGVQESPIRAVSREMPDLVRQEGGPDKASLQERLKSLCGMDGDFELQTRGTPPSAPWNGGPNSVVKVEGRSQSPYQNVYEAGELGIHMPNRGEYDGFGLTFSNPKLDEQGRLFLGFDFCCAAVDAGGDGSWRYYIGHGPGNSAAVELYFNGSEFFQRSGDSKVLVAPLGVGEWRHVQLTLDTRAKTYTGSISSLTEKTEFHGEMATGWDGAIDYTFVDSYGHIGGVRPALDVDNFVMSDQPLPSLEEVQKQTEGGTLAERRKEVAGIREQLTHMEERESMLRRELTSLIAEGPFPMTYGVVEGTPHNVRIQKRGEPDNLGPEVPRGFVEFLGESTLPPDTSGSGRLELARWLTRTENPLTARVMVNRIWQYHFGQGLVKTPNDFGMRGLPPTHPELIAYLATEFIRSGWSVKAMHRLIMLSATYQQGSELSLGGMSSPGIETTDLYVCFPRRRMSAEEIRDAILAVSGELDRTPGREHPFPSPLSWGYSQHAPFNAVYDHNKRSVYLMTQRLKRHPFLGLFDGADPNTSTALRMTTTVPTQALFFLNDPFVHEKSEEWASRLLADYPDEAKRVIEVWRKSARAGTYGVRADGSERIPVGLSSRARFEIHRSDRADVRLPRIYERS